MKLTRIVSGKNIEFRPITGWDVNQYYIDQLNDPEVNQYLECRIQKHTIGNQKYYIENILDDDFSIMFIIRKKDNLEFIGTIKIGNISIYHNTGNIGIMIFKDYWNKGYGTEAIKLITKFAFEELKLVKMNAGCYSNNVASIKAFTSAGYLIEGTQYGQYQYKDTRVNGILLGYKR